MENVYLGEKLVRILFKCIKKVLKDKISYIRGEWNKKSEYLKAYVNEKDFSQLKIEHLAAKDDLDDCDEYCNVLEYGIENKRVFNIAITGPYGSGKSSLLRTFEKKYVKYKYINISLAAFVNGDVTLEGELNEEELKEQENTIEKAILQQLFYRVDSKRIPYARFRKIKDVGVWSIIKNIILFTTTVGLAIVIFKPNIISKVIERVNELYSFSNKYIVILLYGLFIYLIIYNISLITKTIKAKVNLASVTFENAQIEFENNGSESILNKYLDEILYFFEVTNYNVVVIEDLDRFNNTQIFTKLRELNNLINNYEKIKRKVVFIYAIKDEMFKNDERTKFFELIVPVIPVMNSINSGDILLEKIRQDDLGKDISNEFIIGVSVYIEDMRLLTNIYNEYRVYKNRLNDISLKSENILALVIYKNLYPSDFSNLLYNKGLLYSAFKNKKNSVKEIEKNLDEDIENLKLKINRIENEQLQNIKELKGVFLNYISENKSQISQIEGYTIDQFMNDDFDIKSLFNKDGKINYRYYENRSGEYRNYISVKDINNKLLGDTTFIERFDDIECKTESGKNKLAQEIQILIEERNKLHSLKLYELIKNYGVNKVLGEEILKEKVIVYLLRNNKINETYINYLTYFHNNIVTAQDMNYILGVRNYEAQSFDYELTKIDNIIDKLNKLEFEQKEILNFNLLKHIINNKFKYQNHFNIILKQLSDESEISIRFIDEIINILSDEEEEVFWNNICKEWMSLWRVISNNCNYNEEKLNLYILKIIKYVDIEIIKKINIEDEFKKYIENNKESLKLFSVLSLEKTKEIVNSLNIKFGYINVGQVNDELIKFIVDEKYYKINEPNIEYILKEICDKDVRNIRKKNLTTIRESGSDILNEYIDDNILEYVENVFLSLEENNDEDINQIVELLNFATDIIDIDIKKDIISKEEFKLEYIDEVDDELWSELLIQDKVKTSWSNIICYYRKVEILDSILVSYLNNESVYKELSEDTIEKNDINLELIKQIFISKELTVDSINYLVKSLTWRYEKYDTSTINKRLIPILIDNNIFKLTESVYDSLKENYDKLHIKLVECNLKEYVENIQDFKVNYKDIYEILCLENCEYKYKRIIISNIKEEIDSNDDGKEKLLQKISNIVVIEKHQINLGENLYWEIFNNSNDEYKIKLLSCQCRYLEVEQIDLSLEQIGGKFKNITTPLSREKIKYSDDIMELAINLKSCNYISSKSIIDGKDGDKYVQFNTKKNKGN